MIEIRALRGDDNREGFRSGDVELDRFFHKFAWQNQFRLHIGTAYVAVVESEILGFEHAIDEHSQHQRDLILKIYAGLTAGSNVR